MALNDDIFDDMVRHQFDLERVKIDIRNKIFTLLDDVEDEMTSKIISSNLGGKPFTEIQQRRFNNLRDQINYFQKLKYIDIDKLHNEQLKILAKSQSQQVLNAINNPIGIDIATITLSSHDLANIASDTLIDGAPSSEWWKTQDQNLQKRFANNIRIGLVQAETNDQLVQRIRGTKKNNFKDGIMKASKSEAEALVRTSVQSISQETNLQTYEKNQDVIKEVQQISTLDSKTTQTCIAYDNKRWKFPKKGSSSSDYIPVGHSLPFISSGGSSSGTPRHWKCRSFIIPVTKSFEELPTKSGGKPKKLTTTQKKAAQEMLKKVAKEKKKRIKTLSPEEKKLANKTLRASMDGSVPSEIDALGWIEKKPKTFINQTIGKTKTELLQRGILKQEDLVDQEGRPLSVEQLLKKIEKKTKPKKVKPKATKPKSKPKIKPKIENPSPQKPSLTTIPISKSEEDLAFGKRLDRDVTFNEMKDSGLFVKGLKKKEKFDIVEIWNKDFKMKPKDFINGLKKDIPDNFILEDLYTSFDANLYLPTRQHQIEVIFRNEKTKEFIKIRRNFLFSNKHNPIIKHDWFEIPKSLQGKGFAKKIIRNWNDLYTEIGVEKLTVSASLDVGGYAWAKYGFVPKQKSWDILRNSIIDNFDDIVDVEQLSVSDIDFLGKMVNNKDPKTIWKIADSDIGKKILPGRIWEGELDFKNDLEALTRYKKYLGIEQAEKQIQKKLEDIPFKPLNLKSEKKQYEYYKKQSNKYFLNQDITYNEKQSIKDYTGSVYNSINKKLRTGKVIPENKEYIENTIKNINNVINKFGLLEDDIETFRGTTVEFGKGNLGKLYENIVQGKNIKGTILEDRAFTSTTLDENVVFGFMSEDLPMYVNNNKKPAPVKFIIELPKNTTGAAFIGNGEEREILLNHNIDFEIKDAKITTLEKAGVLEGQGPSYQRKFKDIQMIELRVRPIIRRNP